MNKNTVLFVEPRILANCCSILNHFVTVLGPNWNYVFYCGENTKEYWEQSYLNKKYELRELEVINFNKPSEYSDFLKSKNLWESLTGDFVLVAQLDTWIFNNKNYTIDYFIKLNKSYIGGNMIYPWHEFKRENINFNYYNFNGGLSLRKRIDMIQIINAFPPEHTYSNSNVLVRNINSDAEDVYFTLGCYYLGLPIGNDEESSHFALHTIFKDEFFGIHQPCEKIKHKINELYPDLKMLNPFLKLN